MEINQLEKRLQHFFLLVLTAMWLGAPAWAGDAATGENQQAVGEVIFIAGAATADREGSETPLQKGDPVFEDDLLRTAGDGYIHVRFTDGGLISLRPDTEARIDQYHYDEGAAEANRVELHLNGGVMRSATGDAGKSNKEAYRINTPVAAIGIRGTDFVVFADAAVARLAVNAGGVVMAPFSDTCSRKSLSPCGGAPSAELFADADARFLEARSGVDHTFVTDEGPSPDEISPPHPEESSLFDALVGATGNNGFNNGGQSAPDVASYEEGLERAERYLGEESLANEAHLLGRAESDSPLPRERKLVEEPEIIWGRWGGQVGVASQVTNSEWTILNSSEVFALLERRNAERRVPDSGRASFQLDAYEAYVDRDRQPLEAAGISNPALVIDFDDARFATSLDVHATSLPGGRVLVLGGGELTDKGFLYSDADSPALINGVITTDALQAGYLFSYQVEPGVDIEGATRWVNSGQLEN